MTKRESLACNKDKRNIKIMELGKPKVDLTRPRSAFGATSQIVFGPVKIKLDHKASKSVPLVTYKGRP